MNFSFEIEDYVPTHNKTENNQKLTTFIKFFHHDPKIFKMSLHTLNGWATEQTNKKVLWMTIEGEVSGVCLLHKLESDPVYKNPYLIDYIFVLPNKRRMGVGKCIILNIKRFFETTAAPIKRESARLFMKTGYRFFMDPVLNLPLCAFP